MNLDSSLTFGIHRSEGRLISTSELTDKCALHVRPGDVDLQILTMSSDSISRPIGESLFDMRRGTVAAYDAAE